MGPYRSKDITTSIPTYEGISAFEIAIKKIDGTRKGIRRARNLRRMYVVNWTREDVKSFLIDFHKELNGMKAFGSNVIKDGDLVNEDIIGWYTYVVGEVTVFIVQKDI